MDKQLEKMRHSCSHVLAAAVLKLYPKVKFGIGPAIEDGFYYDFDFGKKKITEKDLEKISQEMKKISKAKLPFKKEDVSIKEAKQIFKNQPFKLELIKDLEKEKNKKVSVYQTGNFIDLCAGPHLTDTSKIGSFKLLSLAGAYWRGSETNPMLTRIYGTCFATQEKLDSHLKELTEAKERDHRKLGNQLDLFSLNDQIGAGLPLWHPNLSIVRAEIESYWKDLHQKHGYQYIYTPHIGKKSLWEKSGHWQFYRDLMYSPMDIEGTEYLIKPMNCPFHVYVYKSQIRSYRELPIRYCELGTVYRYEPSGVLHGLTRVRGFTQDDSHIFCQPKQLEKELVGVLNLTKEIYNVFGFKDFHSYLSTRPEKSMGSDTIWEKATKSLKSALKKTKLPYDLDPGAGVFYGPKIDLKVKDSLGREWQLLTNQVDFNFPEKFKLSYMNKKGQQRQPVMVHRAILGSFERFMGILIEHYGGAFPVWLAPVQAIVIPITDKHNQYGQKIVDQIKKEAIRAKLDNRSETTSKKIRNAEIQKIPYILVVGDKEVEAKNINVRVRGEKVLGLMAVSKFLKLIKEDIAKKRQV
ncbi:MAG TPA: threonine--tRNA ligase [Patescibacteria group bacterium]|nr:threonine--tRNA ligase [Patescibacteria group bacterium]